MQYEFTNDWFMAHWNNWKPATECLTIRKVLEIGAFEGRSTCTIIDHFGAKAPLVVVSIDTWHGGVEHKDTDMMEVEGRFDRNTAKSIASAPNKVQLVKRKGSSVLQMAKLLAEGEAGTFDLIFVDGSHQASDVLADCVLSYELCRTGGVIICDDYLWSMESEGKEQLFNMPKLGIDAFSLAYTRKIKQIPLHLYQAYFRKLA